MRFKARFATLLKAIIQVKAHTRKSKGGAVAQVKAHARYIQSAAERKDLISKLAARMAGGEEPRHKTAASALGLARHLSRNDKGATYHVARTEDGHHVVRKGEAPPGGDRIHVTKGKATLHRADGETRSLKHLKGPVWLEGEAVPQGHQVAAPKAKAEPKGVAKAPEPKAKAPKRAASRGSEGEAFVDVGEKIGGARKDVWEALNGTGLNYSQIDWDEVAKNPDLAERHITKQNLTRALAPEALEQAGMPPHLAFLATKLLETIPNKPETDSPGARKAFAEGLWRIQRSIFAVTKPEDYRTLSYDLRDILRGMYVRAEDEEDHSQANKLMRQAQLERAKLRNSEEYRLAEDDLKDLYKQWQTALSNTYTRRPPKGVTKEDLVRAADEAHKYYMEANQAFRESKIYKDAEALGALSGTFIDAQQHIKREGGASSEGQAAKASILALGKRLGAFAVQSGAFWDKHYQDVIRGKVTDFSWAGPKVKEKGEGEPEAKPKADDNPDKMPRWTRNVPDEAVRIGGTKMPTQSSSDLMKAFGLRAVEYGNWVSQDEAEHHTTRAAEAFLDLANLLGLEQDDISYGGRLAMAFGARGKGRALAHYEPGRKVINMTKMAGGGSLAHEWAHFLDNVLHQVHADEGGENSYLSTSPPSKNTPPAVQAAWANLWKAMTEHPDGGFAKKTIKPGKRRYTHPRVAKMFKEGVTNPQELLAKVVDSYMEERQSMQRVFGRVMSTEETRAKLESEFAPVVTSLTKKPVVVTDASKPRKTDFLRLADAQSGGYWNHPAEMFARAFEAHIEDRLRESGATNTYLVTGTHPKSISKSGEPSTLADVWPYPQNKEREVIGKAMAAFLDAVKESGALQKALSFLARLA